MEREREREREREFWQELLGVANRNVGCKMHLIRRSFLK